MTDKDYRKLNGCDTALIQRVDRVLIRMAAAGYRLMVTDGFRSVEQQQAIWWFDRVALPGGKWKPKPGITRHRTNADGIVNKSNHQSGRAADCTFVINGQPSWHEHLPWKLYAEAAKAEGLLAGYYWKKPDKPHVELPKENVHGAH